MSEKAAHEGHRARVREKFLSGDAASRSDAALLEFLLIYAIPADNLNDTTVLPAVVKEKLKLTPVTRVEEVLKAALLPS